MKKVTYGSSLSSAVDEYYWVWFCAPRDWSEFLDVHLTKEDVTGRGVDVFASDVEVGAVMGCFLSHCEVGEAGCGKCEN